MQRAFIPVSRYVKIITIRQDVPELWSQMYCHVFYESECTTCDHCCRVAYVELCCRFPTPISVHEISILHCLDDRGELQLSSTQRDTRGTVCAETCPTQTLCNLWIIIQFEQRLLLSLWFRKFDVNNWELAQVLLTCNIMSLSMIIIIYCELYCVSKTSYLWIVIILTYTVRLRSFRHKSDPESRQSKHTLFSHLT